MKTLFNSLVSLISTAVASWIVNCGLLYLAFLCLDIPFSVRMATGIWLLQAFVRSTLKDTVKVKVK